MGRTSIGVSLGTLYAKTRAYAALVSSGASRRRLLMVSAAVASGRLDSAVRTVERRSTVQTSTNRRKALILTHGSVAQSLPRLSTNLHFP